jgi:hypothetical protein
MGFNGGAVKTMPILLQDPSPFVNQYANVRFPRLQMSALSERPSTFLTLRVTRDWPLSLPFVR